MAKKNTAWGSVFYPAASQGITGGGGGQFTSGSGLDALHCSAFSSIAHPCWKIVTRCWWRREQTSCCQVDPDMAAGRAGAKQNQIACTQLGTKSIFRFPAVQKLNAAVQTKLFAEGALLEALSSRYPCGCCRQGGNARLSGWHTDPLNGTLRRVTDHRFKFILRGLR